SLLDSFVTQLSPYSLLISPDIPSISFFSCRRHGAPRYLHSFPTRRSSDLRRSTMRSAFYLKGYPRGQQRSTDQTVRRVREYPGRSEEHTSELQSHLNLVCRLLLEKKKTDAMTDAYRSRILVGLAIRERIRT